MRVCGIELKRDIAILVVLRGTPDSYNIEYDDCIKFKLENSKDQDAVRKFREELNNYLSFQDFEAIAIKERMTKGRFSGSPISFKIEGFFQLSDYPVRLVHSATLASKVKEVMIDSGTLKKEQQKALEVAYFLLLQDV